MNQSIDEFISDYTLDWIEQCFTSPAKKYRLYVRRFLEVKRPNQQYQSTEGTYSTQTNQTNLCACVWVPVYGPCRLTQINDWWLIDWLTYNKETWTQNTVSSLVYNNIGWLGDGSHRGQGWQAWTRWGCRCGTPFRLHIHIYIKNTKPATTNVINLGFFSSALVTNKINRSTNGQ